MAYLLVIIVGESAPHWVPQPFLLLQCFSRQGSVEWYPSRIVYGTKYLYLIHILRPLGLEYLISKVTDDSHEFLKPFKLSALVIRHTMTFQRGRKLFQRF
jgi:hypothetical protein